MTWKMGKWAVFMLLSVSYCTGAPVSTLTSGFWAVVDKGPLASNCSYLHQIKSDKYTYQELGRVCNGIDDVDANWGQRNLTFGVCYSLVDLFPKLCKLSVNATNTSVNVDLKLAMQSRSDGVANLCKNLNEIIINIMKNSASDPKASGSNWAFPFPVVDTNNEQTLGCSSVCKDTKGDTLHFDRDVNPACVLLLEGYKMYQNLSTQPVITTNSQLLKDTTGTSSMIASHDTGTRVQSKQPLDVSTSTLKQPKTEHSEDELGGKNSISQQQNEMSPTEKIPETNVQTNKPMIEKTEVAGNSAAPAVNNIGESNDNLAKHDSSPVGMSSLTSELATKPEKHQEAVKPAVSKHTSSTTEAAVDNPAVDGLDNLPVPPKEANSKVEKSTEGSVSTDKNDAGISKPNKDSVSDGQVLEQSIVQNTEKDDTLKKDGVDKPSSPTKNDDSGMASFGEDDNNAEYNAPDTSKKSPKQEGDVIENNLDHGYDETESFKPSKEKFPDIAIESHGTTINVSLNESEDTGFFNYFLFCITLVGVLYLVIHNKKKLIAYVVEGKRPNGRSRRSSSSSQYRRLENNFD